MQSRRRRRQQAMEQLARLLTPRQAELYRAFLKGLELGRPPQRALGPSAGRGRGPWGGN